MNSWEEINSHWEKAWEDGKTTWHSDNVHTALLEHFQTLVQGSIDAKRILVPLCGKTVDMKWLYDQGLSVVGIEISSIAITSFFEENSLSYKVDEKPSYKLYQHDERLNIFQCDLFSTDSMMLGGLCNYLWDRGSLVAMEPSEAQNYVNHINSLLTPKGCILLECCEYDPAAHTGPPASIPIDRLKQLVGDSYEINEVDRKIEDRLTAWIGSNVLQVIYVNKRR